MFHLIIESYVEIISIYQFLLISSVIFLMLL